MVKHLAIWTNICEVVTNFRGSSHILGTKSNKIDLCLTKEFYSFHIFWSKHVKKSVVFWLIVYFQ